MRIQFAIKGQLGIINELILIFLIFLYQTPPLSSIEWLSVVLSWRVKFYLLDSRLHILGQSYRYSGIYLCAFSENISYTVHR
jgi:hypothetical protein